MSQERKSLSRRAFLATTAAGIVGLAAGATIGSKAFPEKMTETITKTITETRIQTTTQTSTISDVPLHEQVWSFEIPPSIPEKDIIDVLSTDILVIGGGISGLVATVSAAEEGVSVITLEKGDSPFQYGWWYGVIGSKLHKERGINIDKNHVWALLQRAGLFRIDPRLIKMWVDNSGKVMDWLLDIIEDESGIKYDSFPIETHPEKVHNGEPPKVTIGGIEVLRCFPTAILLPSNTVIVPSLLKRIEKLKGKVLFGTAGVQLLKDGDKVVGAVAKTKDGYIKINSKAVILATGGYEGNKLMLRKYIPEADSIVHVLGKPLNTGDGILMAQWVGAAIDPWPHAPMLFDWGLYGTKVPTLENIFRQPWLAVNMFGERFYNEDNIYGYTCKAYFYQPGHFAWVIWDDKWRDEEILLRMGGTVCERTTNKYIDLTTGVFSNEPIIFHKEEWVEELINKGAIIRASTIDELASKMGVPIETLKKTINRYNELAMKGIDEDFGKDPHKLVAIDKPPYYAAKVGPALLVTLSGVRVTPELNVLSKDWKVIKGLYAVGNTCGGFFAYEYPVAVTGDSMGRAITTGYIAAKKAVEYVKSL